MTTAIEKELMKDHKRINKLLSDLEKANDKEDEQAEVIFEELKTELVAHSKAEDKVYYSELKEHEETEDMIYEAKEEHKIVENLLNEISKLNISNPEWKAKCKVLKEMVEHHVEEEEGELFEAAAEIIDKAEGEELKNNFLDKKEAMETKKAVGRK